jgi:hypothetical protein
VIDIKSGFDPGWLTLRCVSQRSDAEFSVDAVLQRAQSSLERYGATTAVDRNAKSLRFWRTSRTGGSWITTIARGSVRVEASGNHTVVEIRASVLPTVAMATLFGVVVGMTGAAPFAFVLFGFVFGFNILSAYRGLRSVAADAVRL